MAGQKKYTPEDILTIRDALESGNLSLAIRIHRTLFPPHPMPLIHETDEGDLRECFETPLPIFLFCSADELRELRIRMALALCLCDFPIERSLRPDAAFPWPYLMLPRAVAQNFSKAIANHRNVAGWIKSGIVGGARILNSSDGPCQACKAAAQEYALSDLPSLPLHTCENLNTIGCRCSVAPTRIAGLSQKW